MKALAKKSPIEMGDHTLKNNQHEELLVVYYNCFYDLVHNFFSYCLYQRQINDLLHGFYIMKNKPFNKITIYLINIFFILPAKDDLF